MIIKFLFTNVIQVHIKTKSIKCNGVFSMNVHFMESVTVNRLAYKSHRRGDEFVDALYFVPLFNSRR